MIQGLPKEHHPAVLLRCKVLDTFSGARNKWQNGHWAGNYLENDTDFKLAVNKLRTQGDGIGQIFFTDKGKREKLFFQSHIIIKISPKFLLRQKTEFGRKIIRKNIINNRQISHKN